MERRGSSMELNEIDKKDREEYFSQRDTIVSKDKQDYFVVDVDDLSTENELKAEAKLQELKRQLSRSGKLFFLEEFYVGKEKAESSELYKWLYEMPKGGLLHYHLTASAPLEFLISLTKEDIVYYNIIKNKIVIYPAGEPDEGYVQCNEIRKEWTMEGTFDDFLRQKILLNSKDVSSQDSNQIWKNFQPKFDLTFQLYNYHHFFKRIVMEVLRKSIQEKCYLVEFKHIFGCLIDDNHKMVDLKDEIKIFEE